MAPLLHCRHNGRVQMTEGGRKYATRCPFTGGRVGKGVLGWETHGCCPQAPTRIAQAAIQLLLFGGPLLQATSPPCAAPAARRACTTALSTRPIAWSREQRGPPPVPAPSRPPAQPSHAPARPSARLPACNEGATCHHGSRCLRLCLPAADGRWARRCCVGMAPSWPLSRQAICKRWLQHLPGSPSCWVPSHSGQLGKEPLI